MQYPFFSVPLKTLLASTVLSVAATGAVAQTPAPATNPSTVGVTPQDASEAMQKAVPRADTGTVVRTDESAPDKARSAVDTTRANNAAMPAATMNNDTHVKRNTTRSMPRRARADRN
ncbi:hypothetical protein [Simplicispira psychrophila]|uniref:hypothetical protein n=1 Tax=Simplicispira psychrophila TaxID=80882 RepID=UPI000487F734|nr:hypothetical protein [Simplicispira psychrophila]